MHCRPASSFARAARVAAALLLLLTALPALADDAPIEDEAPAPPEPAQPATPPPVVTPPAPEAAPAAPAEVELPPADEPAPAAASERPISGIWKGRHRLELVAGYHFGNAVRDAGILAAPITGQPGSRTYPSLSALSVEMDDAPVVGIRYSWFAGEKWGLQIGLEHVASEILDPDVDLALDAQRLTATNLTPQQQAALLARLEAHQARHDMKVTFLDLGAMHVFNPKKRWPIEVGGGIGWAFPTLDGPVAYERLVTSDTLQGSVDPVVVANEVQDPAPPFGQCLADNDPCIELKQQGGLTWHAFMSIGYAFTPSIQLRLGGKARFIEHLVDPGDSSVMTEATIGLAFQFGGQ